MPSFTFYFALVGCLTIVMGRQRLSMHPSTSEKGKSVDPVDPFADLDVLGGSYWDFLSVPPQTSLYSASTNSVQEEREYELSQNPLSSTLSTETVAGIQHSGDHFPLQLEEVRKVDSTMDNPLHSSIEASRNAHQATQSGTLNLAPVQSDTIYRVVRKWSLKKSSRDVTLCGIVEWVFQNRGSVDWDFVFSILKSVPPEVFTRPEIEQEPQFIRALLIYVASKDQGVANTYRLKLGLHETFLPKLKRQSMSSQVKSENHSQQSKTVGDSKETDSSETVALEIENLLTNAMQSDSTEDKNFIESFRRLFPSNDLSPASTKKAVKHLCKSKGLQKLLQDGKHITVKHVQQLVNFLLEKFDRENNLSSELGKRSSHDI